MEKVKILTERYEASEGQEVFISAEDPENNVLLGYLRMRVPSPKAHRPEITDSAFSDCAGTPRLRTTRPSWKTFRELHGSIKAMDKELLAEAERIASEEFGVKKLLVISALGTRRYYMRLGYET